VIEEIINSPVEGKGIYGRVFRLGSGEMVNATGSCG